MQSTQHIKTEQQLTAMAADLKALRDMKDSRGWAILMETVERDVLTAAFQISDDPRMTEKEIDFRRGAIAAARGFRNVLEVLIMGTENELLTASAEKLARSTTPDATARKDQ